MSKTPQEYLCINLCVRTAWFEKKSKMEKEANQFLNHIALKHLRILDTPLMVTSYPGGVFNFSIKVPKARGLEVVESLSLLEDKFNFQPFIEFKPIKARMELGDLHHAILELSNKIVKGLIRAEDETS